MMFYCKACHKLYLVAGQEEELRSLLRDEVTFECITPLCRGLIQKISIEFARRLQQTGVEARTIPVSNFFRALHGFGLYLGDPAAVSEIQRLLIGNRVVKVSLEEVGQPERTLVNKMWLDNGVCLHFGSSAKGACIYYVEWPAPSCLEVFDERANDSDPGAGERAAQDGEEGGRAPEVEAGASRSTGAEPAVAEPAVDGAGVPTLPEIRDIKVALPG